MRIKPAYVFLKDGSADWSTISVRAISPVGTRFMRVILYSGNSEQGMIYWDNIELKMVVE